MSRSHTVNTSMKNQTWQNKPEHLVTHITGSLRKFPPPNWKDRSFLHAYNLTVSRKCKCTVKIDRPNVSSEPMECGHLLQERE